ncbi:hypothetical protein [Brevibacillus dissolubilis]|uniref:hypothetical protein n=1 Tax=Brevibacillus dissolubilis TaxID=1844116 RepID=UPI0011161852|nr:hypothetical protein [Brevibacillus dissolubilis]
MMLQKFLPRTPLGIAVTAATVLLSVSPEARKLTRRAAVKGVAALLSVADQVKGMASTATGQMRELVDEARTATTQQDQASSLLQETVPLTYDTGAAPEEFYADHKLTPNLPFNVMNAETMTKNLGMNEQHPSH